MENFLTQKGYRIESFGLNSKLHNYLKSIDLEVVFPAKSVVFFDLTGKSILNNCYSENYLKNKSEYNTIGYNFIFLPKLDFPINVEDAFEYLLPHLKGQINFASDALNNSINSMFDDYEDYIEDYKSILSYLEYKGNIQTGFVVYFEGKVTIIEYTDNKIIDGTIPLQNSIIEVLKRNDNHVFESRRNTPAHLLKKRYEDSLRDKLDEETLQFVLELKEKIEGLKKSGQILYALPLLQKALKNIENQIDVTSLSDIKVDDDYNVILPDFNNLIIPLSHLSKVVYILFIRHPQGIDIKQLWQYEKELLELYLSISPQENYDKMINSIKDLISINSTAIYTHISRIKSTFYKIMDDQFAENYIISGSKNYGSSLKYISLIKIDSNDTNSSLSDDFDIADFM